MEPELVLKRKDSPQDIETLTLMSQIINSKHGRRDEPSIIQTGPSAITLTYGDLEKHVAEVSDNLRALGFQRGSVGCIALPNSLSFVLIFLAVVGIGATVAPLNSKLKKNEVQFALSDGEADFLIGPHGFCNPDSEFAKALQGHPCTVAECQWDNASIQFHTVQKIERADRFAVASTHQDETPALLLHTSGTTGKPKAVPLLQSNLLASAKNVQMAYDLEPKDRSVLIMPLFHIHGIVAGMLAPLICGSCIIIPENGLGPDFWNDFTKHKATWWTATPSHHRILLSFPPPPPDVQPRFIRSCSSPLAPSLLAQIEQSFGCPVLEAYAMTENAHHIASNTMKGPRKSGSVGPPCQAVSLKIIDEQGDRVEAGIRGEVAIKGPSVMSGYRNRPDANKTAFTQDGYFRTGDIGELDDDGHLRLTGRIKEMINKGGEKISPNEVDEVVLEHEAIGEAVTFGIPDDLYGEDVGVALVPKSGQVIQLVDLTEWLRARLSAFKVPRKIWTLEAIPKTATGKVQRAMVAKSVTNEQTTKTTTAAPKAEDIKSLWAQVLGTHVENIHDTADFFDLGGDSVAAIRLSNEAQANGWLLDAAQVFRHPQLKDMTQAMESAVSMPQAQGPSNEQSNDTDLNKSCAFACGMEEEKVQDIQPMTAVQGRFVQTNRELGAWIMPITFACENISFKQLARCMDVVRRRNPILRLRAVQHCGRYYNVIVDDNIVWETGADLKQYISSVMDTRILPGAPHVRCAYILDDRLGPHFVLTVSHAVVDVWTRKLLYEQIQRGLQDPEALSSSGPAPSFLKFANFVNSMDRNQAGHYYSSVLRGFDRASYLTGTPLAGATGIGLSSRIATLQVRNGSFSSKPLWINLAWALTLGAMSGNARVLFVAVSSGRLAGVPGIESIMGPTLTTIPVCIDFSAHKTVQGALARLREVVYGGSRFEAFAPEAMARHFGAGSPEMLLNYSESPETDEMWLQGPNGGLRMRVKKDEAIYGKISVPLHMGVSDGKDNQLRLHAAFNRSCVDPQTVERLLDRFSASLSTLGSVSSDTDVEGLIHSLQYITGTDESSSKV